jgi:hypothetical protein
MDGQGPKSFMPLVLTQCLAEAEYTKACFVIKRQKQAFFCAKN